MLGSWFPVWYHLPPKERAYEQLIVVNWLAVEVDQNAPKRMPVLDELRGWRNREVYCWVKGFDWTSEMVI